MRNVVLGIGIGSALASVGCRSAKPPRQRSAADASKYIDLVLPADAQHVRYHEESLFTLTCVFSLELDRAAAEAFFAANSMLPRFADLRENGQIADSMDRVGQTTPWWDLAKDGDTVYGESTGRRTVKGATLEWSMSVGLAGLNDSMVRIFMIYVEESAASDGG
ncbi:MAG: hypothetical protein PVJ57_22660 [Phycisphaerae bacterium]